MNPLVSIILPVYNAGYFLKRAIDSILAQTYSYWELLILNDGSTDNSLEIIKSYTDQRIKLINSQTNKGLIRQLNKGLELAQGKYIARMDADDIALPERLEKQVAFMEQNPEIGVLGTRAKVIDSDGIVIRHWNTTSKHEDIKAELLEGAVLCHPTVMFRTKVLTEQNIQYSDNWPHLEDYELWTRLIQITKFRNLPEYLLKYRVFEKQVSSVYNNEQVELMRKLRRQLLNKITGQNNTFIQVHYLLANNWKKIKISDLKTQWNEFTDAAAKHDYSVGSLNRLFTKRIFYYIADKKYLTIKEKLHILHLINTKIKYWSLRQFIFFLKK